MSLFRPEIDRIPNYENMINLTDGLNNKIKICSEGYYYIYIITVWELEIYYYFKEKGFSLRAYTENFNEPEGFPILENEKWYIDHLPLIKYKRSLYKNELNQKFLDLKQKLGII